ncbi:MAG: hypothetical protein LUE17_08890 [Planctomycetaceae bacterium]|nr:hypothetical protein [Planctomycetaceae bacterium]
MEPGSIPSIPPRRNPSGQPYPLVVRQEDGFTITVKDDGYDYLGLYRRILRGEAATTTLLYDDAEHYVHRVEADGRSFVFKRFGEMDGKIDTRVWRYAAGPFYSHLMRMVNRAVANGCDVVQDIYLVAEKMRGRLSHDNYILFEFIPGTSMDRLADFDAHHDAVAEAFTELHRHGLALGHCKPGNLVLSEDGRVKIIDLSARGTQWMGRGKDAVKAKRLWNIHLPRTRLVDALARLYAAAQLDVTRLRRAVKAGLRLKEYH